MLILLRHGQTEANAQGLLQGRIDPDLDDVGRRQAVAAAQWLGPVDRVISSPLVRARQTAAVLTGSSNDVEIDERFIELNYGEWERSSTGKGGRSVTCRHRPGKPGGRTCTSPRRVGSHCSISEPGCALHSTSLSTRPVAPTLSS